MFFRNFDVYFILINQCRLVKIFLPQGAQSDALSLPALSLPIPIVIGSRNEIQSPQVYAHLSIAL